MSLNVDVADLIDEFRIDGGIVIERRLEPTIDDAGEAVEQAKTRIEIADAAVHTASERDLDRVPEADRRREAIRVYTKQRIRTSGDGYAADVIVYDGKRYEAIEVADYMRQGGVYMATCLLEELRT